MVEPAGVYFYIRSGVLLSGVLLGDRYKVLRKLGEGGEGEIYVARDLELRRNVAIKFQNPRAFESTQSYASYGKFIKQEYDRLGFVKSIQGIPQVFDNGTFGRNNRQYLVMELVDGVTFTHWISEHHPVPAEAAVSAVGQLCEILVRLHAARYVHRDVTPNNAMVQLDGRIRLLDVGISVSTGTLNTDGGGSPGYAAPEQFDPTAKLTPQADVFAIGALLFKMLAPQLPYSGEEHPVRSDAVPFPQGLAVEMSDSLRSLALAMISLDPGERPSAAEVLRDLQPMLPVFDSPASPKATCPDPTAPYRLGLSMP
ncbi:serine/threonine-protein kinase [Streptomyces sp. NPDC088341]|uniref:serine/threonine protein kinase n=1 Tax=Streptomyces sp. NPDC088341 TaxID=3154870 RepID=UPI0034490B0B